MSRYTLPPFTPPMGAPMVAPILTQPPTQRLPLMGAPTIEESHNIVEEEES
jgi:hypothetical protein